jgi:HlyD family secretion protein
MMKLAAAVVAVVVLAWLGYRTFAGAPEPATVSANVIRTATATSGNLVVSLRVAGSTTAQDFVSVRAPMQRNRNRMPMTLERLVPSGRFVKKGEIIAQVENQFLIDRMDDEVAQLAQADLNLRKLQAQQGVDLESSRQSLRVTKASLDKAEMELRTSEIRTDIDRELLRLSVEEVRAQYVEQQKNLANLQIVQKAALRISQISREQQMQDVDRSKLDLERFTIRAPIDGLAVTEVLWRRGEQQTVQEGDQVGPGQPVLRIVNPASMIVQAMVNQSASSLLRIGQKANILVDAFPGMKFSGEVYSIGALAVGSQMQNNYVRYIPVKVKINGADPRLIPDLSASADVQLEKSDVATLVPRSAVSEENGKPVVFVKAGDQFQKRTVEVGLRNSAQAAITSGLQPGEVVRISN